MKVSNNVKIELTVGEHNALLEAQKIWQGIELLFDDNGVDIQYITDVLDKELSDLLDACEKGVTLEE